MQKLVCRLLLSLRCTKAPCHLMMHDSQSWHHYMQSRSC